MDGECETNTPNMKQLNGCLAFCEVVCKRKHNTDINYRQEEIYLGVYFPEKLRSESTMLLPQQVLIA